MAVSLPVTVKSLKYERIREVEPPELSLTSLYHVAIPVSYFLIGFIGSFLANPLNIFMVQDLNAQPSQQNTLFILITIPWSLKVLCGFLSDLVPIRGLKRKPYLAMGYLLSSICFLVLAIAPVITVNMLYVLLFLAVMGQIMADVMADTLVVERARQELEGKKGQLQASCYAIRFFGSVLGCVGGAVFFNTRLWGWGLTFSQVCFINGALPLALLGPTIWTLWEGQDKHAKTVRDQVMDIWETIQLKAVWKPMAFVYTFNFFQVPNIAWQSYLQLSLHFEPYQLGFMGAAGSIMTFLGIVAYKRFFFHVSWRLVYGWTVVVTTVFSALQLVLIFQLNQAIGLPNFWFALGDDVITQYIQGIQFLPVSIMYLSMCPDGSEGAIYAMLTTFGNVALTCASSLGTVLSKIWDVSNEAMMEHDYAGLWRLTILTSALAPVPLVLLKLLPANQQAQEHLRLEKEKSWLGGAVFLGVLGASLTWVFYQAFDVILTEGKGA